MPRGFRLVCEWKLSGNIGQAWFFVVFLLVGSWFWVQGSFGWAEEVFQSNPQAGSAGSSLVQPSGGEKLLASQKSSPEIQQLFDGRSLAGWKVLEELAFKTHGNVKVQQGQILLGRGEPFTGIQWTGPFPRSNYEVVIEACRVEGDDFFCGLVFPVGKEDCSLIVGGWGGSTVGLSNIDGEPAAENETATVCDFEKGRWYTIRLRVTDEKILVWIDQQKVVDFEYPGRKLSIRWDQEPMRPFGICTWRTTGAVRKVQVCQLGKGHPTAQPRPAPSEPSKQASGKTASFETALVQQSASQQSSSARGLPTELGVRGSFPVPKTFDGKGVDCRVELQKLDHGFRVYRFWYPSPVETPVEQNNTIPAEYYLPEGAESGPARPAVIVLHILNGNYELERLLCRTLALRGIPSMMFKLPYYDERAPAGGRKRLLQEAELFVRALPQAVADCRRSIDVLAARPEVDPAKVSLAGISLGGIVGATGAAVDSRVHRAALILAGGDLRAIIQHCREARPIRQFLESLPPDRRQQVEEALQQIDPLRHAEGLRQRAQAGRVLMVNATQDEVIPRACTEKLAQALGIADRVIWLEGLGHYTAIAALPETLAQATAFFAQDLPAEAKPPVVETPKAETPLQVATSWIRELLSIFLQEPPEGKCHLLDLSAELTIPGSNKKYEGRFRWIRGHQHRFRLELNVAGLPEVRTGQGDRPWLASAKRVFVGRAKEDQQTPTAPPRVDPLKFVPDRHLVRAKAWIAALQGMVQMPSLLQSLVEAEEVPVQPAAKVANPPSASAPTRSDQPASPLSNQGRVILLRQKEKKQNTLRMVLTPEGRPTQLELSVDKVQAKIRVYAWQLSAPAPEGLFAPPDGPVQEVDPEELAHIWSALVEFMMEKTE